MILKQRLQVVVQRQYTGAVINLCSFIYQKILLLFFHECDYIPLFSHWIVSPTL